MSPVLQDLMIWWKGQMFPQTINVQPDKQTYKGTKYLEQRLWPTLGKAPLSGYISVALKDIEDLPLLKADFYS